MGKDFFISKDLANAIESGTVLIEDVLNTSRVVEKAKKKERKSGSLPVPLYYVKRGTGGLNSQAIKRKKHTTPNRTTHNSKSGLYLKGGLNLFETEKQPEPFDMMCTIQLHNAIVAKKIMTRHVISRKWPDQFRLLRKSNDQGLIEDVLDWYCQNMKGKHVPKCKTATSFRKKFDAILAAMERDGIHPQLEISIRAKMLEKELRMLTWPKGSGSQLLFSIQSSLNNYTDFYSRLNKYSKQDGSRLERIAYEISAQLGGPSQFIRQWFTQVHKDVSDWEGWSGDLVSREFDVNKQRFKRMCQGIAGNYCGRPQEWNNLIGELYEE